MLISLPIYLCTKLLQRYEIVNGVVEAEGVADEAKTEEEEEDKAAEGTFICSTREFYLVEFICSLILK